MRELQKLRQRPNGINIVGLALGKKITIEEEITIKDPFKVASGGMVNMQALKTGKVKKVDDAYDTGIGTQFSVETNKRDEDEEMQKYIEEELQRRKGVKSADDNEAGTSSSKKYLTPEEAALQALPEHLRKNNLQKSEEMLSNQMLNGIPEVDLGIEAKIRNIEATEEAKQRMIQEQKMKKDVPSHFVPINIAANFVQHDRANHDKLAAQKRKQVQMEGEDQEKKRDGKRATDDYYFDKFRNKFRKN